MTRLRRQRRGSARIALLAAAVLLLLASSVAAALLTLSTRRERAKIDELNRAQVRAELDLQKAEADLAALRAETTKLATDADTNEQEIVRLQQEIQAISAAPPTTGTKYAAADVDARRERAAAVFKGALNNIGKIGNRRIELAESVIKSMSAEIDALAAKDVKLAQGYDEVIEQCARWLNLHEVAAHHLARLTPGAKPVDAAAAPPAANAEPPAVSSADLLKQMDRMKTLARSLNSAGKIDEADAQWNQIVEFARAAPEKQRGGLIMDAVNGRAAWLIGRERLVEAESLIRPEFEANSARGARKQLGWPLASLLLKLERPAEAETILRELIAGEEKSNAAWDSSSYVGFRIDLAIALHKLGKTREERRVADDISEIINFHFETIGTVSHQNWIDYLLLTGRAEGAETAAWGRIESYLNLKFDEGINVELEKLIALVERSGTSGRLAAYQRWLERRQSAAGANAPEPKR